MENVTITDNTIHIHGTKDRILPFYCVKSNFIVQDGGHLMTLSHPKEIMDIFKRGIINKKVRHSNEYLT